MAWFDVVNFALFYIFFGNTTNTYFAALPWWYFTGVTHFEWDLFYRCDSLAKKDCHYHIMETIK